MSRVTKLQKLYRRIGDAKAVRYLRGCAKSRRIRRAQGGNIYRGSRRGSWKVPGCRCGHKRHGKYGCIDGCAWGACGGTTLPIEWMPLGLSATDREFEFLSKANAALILGAFGMSPSTRLRTLRGGQRVVIVGDSHMTDLVVDGLDKRS